MARGGVSARRARRPPSYGRGRAWGTLVATLFALALLSCAIAPAACDADDGVRERDAAQLPHLDVRGHDDERWPEPEPEPPIAPEPQPEPRSRSVPATDEAPARDDAPGSAPDEISARGADLESDRDHRARAPPPETEETGDDVLGDPDDLKRSNDLRAHQEADRETHRDATAEDATEEDRAAPEEEEDARGRDEVEARANAFYGDDERWDELDALEREFDLATGDLGDLGDLDTRDEIGDVHGATRDGGDAATREDAEDAKDDAAFEFERAEPETAEERAARLNASAAAREAYEYKLVEMEDMLYAVDDERRDVVRAFKDLFAFVANAPTAEEARRVARKSADAANAKQSMTAKKKLQDAERNILRAFGVDVGDGDDAAGVHSENVLLNGEDAIVVEKIPGTGAVHVKFNFQMADGERGRGAAQAAQAIMQALGVETSSTGVDAAAAAAEGADPAAAVDGVVVVDAAGDVTATTTSATTATATADADADADADAGASDEAARQAAAVEDAAEKVREVIKSTLDPARANADAADGEALDDDDDAEPDPYEDTPDDWIAVSDALFLLAALVEAGLVPPDAYPIPDAHADDPFFDYGTVSWSSRPVDGAHPAKADPKAWARTALVVSGEMGSSEARLAVADRVYHARGAPAEVLAGPKCETALGWIKPVADEAAKDAEKNEDFQLPRSPGLLRERERDARWVSEDQLENGNEQIFMEEDLAARGVPEAQRHLGYRRLMGRGVERDEAEAFRDFEAAAAAGDELAAFNLGYMHMKGISTPQNFTEARRRFEHAARTNKLPAAFNGLGVLHFNGWGVERNYTAARLAFEAGAARGDPDSNFNLGAIYQNGLGVDMDAKKAVEFYEAASEAGHWRAPHVLAIAHHTGSGTDVNCTRAAELYKTFVDERLGWTRLQDDAMATLDGGPVTDDETQKTTDAAPDAWGALVKYVLLAEQGSASATSNAAWVLRKSKDAVIASSGGVLDRETFFTVAREMLERAVVMGEHESHVDLGDLHWEAVRASGGPRPFVPRSVEEGASNGGETASNEGETASNEGETATPSPSPSPPRFPPRDASPEERVYFHYRAASDAGSVEGAVNLAW